MKEKVIWGKPDLFLIPVCTLTCHVLLEEAIQSKILVGYHVFKIFGAKYSILNFI